MLFIKTYSDDLWSFQLAEDRFSYYLDLMGNVIKNIQNYSVTLSPLGQTHLFLLNNEGRLSHHHWDGFSWNKSQSWQRVHPFFRTTSDHNNKIYLLFSSPEGENLAIYHEGVWLVNPLSFFIGNFTPLEFFSLSNNKLLLIYKKTFKQQEELFCRFFFLTSDSWGDEISLTSLPRDHQHLKLWFYADSIYITYVLSHHPVSLVLIIFNGETELFSRQKFSNIPFTKDLPALLTLLEPGLIVLIIQEENKLIYWLSSDQGHIWKTKMEIPCPWAMELMPVLNFQRELTSLIAINSFAGLRFHKPAIIETRELIGLNPFKF